MLNDAALIAALASGCSHVEAAAALGVSARTVGRRLADPAFVAQLAEHRGTIMARAADRLAAATATATDALVSLLDATTPPAVRVSAARVVLDAARRYQESADLEFRLAHLEAVLTPN